MRNADLAADPSQCDGATARSHRVLYESETNGAEQQVSFAQLSPREVQCLVMIADGLSAREAAKRLSITSRTVERHLDVARYKLNARNRTHLVAIAFREGVIE
ncbi:MAG: hypothetical protein CUN54_09875 [Phototrophicales bacterium]|nr:MAG: hypothetical protein CUN54_09875 [Phototrophicales bacterium]